MLEAYGKILEIREAALLIRLYPPLEPTDLALPHDLQELLSQDVGGFNGRILPEHGG